MKLKNIISAFALTALLAGCNDDYLEKNPITSLTEENAFQTYDNFKAYMYQCYALFTDSRISTNFSNQSYYPPYGSMFYGDYYSGLMTTRDNIQNPYAYQTVTVTNSTSNWDFSYPRMVNIMISHLDNSQLKPAEREHWRSVGYFFHAYWYIELLSRFGDVPWINTVLTDTSEEAYGERTPRKQVADSIVARLEYAINNIGSTANDGDNPITADACRALLSRFLLREGTWAKYHGLDEDYSGYLTKCLSVSTDLMTKYPTLYYGNETFNKYPGHGYDEEYTTEDLTGKPGVIFFKQYLNGVLMHRFSDLIHVEANRCDAPQATVDLFLMKNGKPISNAASGFNGGKGKDLWDYYQDRDPRLPINFEPPVQAKVTAVNSNPDNVTTFKKWTFWKAGDDLNGKGNFTVTDEYAEKFRRYIDYFGANTFCENGTGDESIGVKRLPGHNWGGAMCHSAPNITSYCQTDNYMRCWTGYYYWKQYTSWEVGSNSNFQTSDKPIFLISEVMLNYAEAAFELGKFDQSVADKTINKLRDRAGVAPMVVSEIGADFDPDRDKGTAPWLKGYDSKTTYEVAPVLWEIRRERLVELMCLGHSFYDVKRWHKAPYFVNRQPCGCWITAKNVPYGTGAYTGQFVDYDAIKKQGYADPANNDAGSGWIYTKPGPLSIGKGWLDTYYLDMIPLDQINLNPNLSQNPGYKELFGLN